MPTPVTVLTGAFGAGKTTLLRRILREPHGYRIAVIQNEFSDEMGIEAPLITDAAGQTFTDLYELPNGCLCCSAKDGLVSALDRLLEVEGRFDYVLVEATGVADPEAVCEVFWVDENLGCQVRLDGVVALVDGLNVLSQLEDGSSLGLEREAAKQVACADVLILNKLDLITEPQRVHARTRLAAMNPAATILESVRAVVPLEAVLGICAFDRCHVVESMSSLCGPCEPCEPCGPCGPQCGPWHLGCKAPGPDAQARFLGHGVESLLLRGEGGALYDPGRVRAWLADVLWEAKAGGVYRCKGLFQGPHEEGGDSTGPTTDLMAYALQGVGKLFEIEEAPHLPTVESKFLFIGCGLQLPVLEAGLRGCRWTAAQGG